MLSRRLSILIRDHNVLLGEFTFVHPLFWGIALVTSACIVVLWYDDATPPFFGRTFWGWRVGKGCGGPFWLDILCVSILGVISCGFFDQIVSERGGRAWLDECRPYFFVWSMF